MAESLTNKSWAEIFNQFNLEQRINNDGLVFISANEIKKYGKREPRLMSKFDDRLSRPTLFKQNDLTILPVKNGEYVLLRGDGYHNLPSLSHHIEFLEWPFGRFETLPRDPRSESQVIDIAFATGLLTHFLDADDLTLTIRGRLRSNPFDFYFNASSSGPKLNVDGVQIEVDAGYEGDKIYLIEAKMGERDDFHIRQLYYPYRMWIAEDVSKEIIPLFINYANDTISITQYKFEDLWDYSSIKLVKTTNYSFELNPISFNLESLVNNAIVNEKEPSDIPFPQANDIRKVRDTIDLISWGNDTRDAIAQFWSVDNRQGDYYANAGYYLGFIKKERKKWILTDKGKQYVDLPTTKRNHLLFNAILMSPVFHEVAHFYLSENKSPEDEFICDSLRKYTSTALSESTLKRRAQTIRSWFLYITKTLDELNQVSS